MEVIDFETFAARHGASEYSEPGLHRLNSSVSTVARKRALARLQATIAEAARERERLQALYDSLVDAGEIRPPTEIEVLQASATGHPDNESTQAAARVLARRAARKGIEQ
jgi:hypothetical protein